MLHFREGGGTFVAGWRHALRSEFIIIIVSYMQCATRLMSTLTVMRWMLLTLLINQFTVRAVLFLFQVFSFPFLRLGCCWGTDAALSCLRVCHGLEACSSE